MAFKMKGSALKDKKWHKANSTKEDKIGVLDHNIKHSDNIWNENHEVNPGEKWEQRKLKLHTPAIEDRFEDDAPTTMKSSGFKMKGSSYKMGGHKTKATMAYMKNMKSPLHQEDKDKDKKVSGDDKYIDGQKILGTGNPYEGEEGRPYLENMDQDYVAQLLEMTGGNKSIEEMNKAHRRLQRLENKEEIEDLKFGKGLNKTLREEKEMQNLMVSGPDGKKRKYYREIIGKNKDGTPIYGDPMKTPKWWSSGKKKKHYIATMRERQIQDLDRKAIDKDTAEELGYYD